MNPEICSAISLRHVIRFYYGGIRILEPFCYGVNKAGDEILRAYQTGGYSKSGHPAGWRLFRVSEISDLIVTDKRFDIRLGYNPKDPAMVTVYCCV